jgi:hypothetical protein
MAGYPTIFEGWMSEPSYRRVFIRNAISYELEHGVSRPNVELLKAAGVYETIIGGAERRLEGKSLNTHREFIRAVLIALHEALDDVAVAQKQRLLDHPEGSA